MTTINKIIIYNDTPKVLTDKIAVSAAYEVIASKGKGKYTSPYLIKDVVVTVIKNKKSTTYRTAKVARK